MELCLDSGSDLWIWFRLTLSLNAVWSATKDMYTNAFVVLRFVVLAAPVDVMNSTMSLYCFGTHIHPTPPSFLVYAVGRTTTSSTAGRSSRPTTCALSCSASCSAWALCSTAQSSRQRTTMSISARRWCPASSCMSRTWSEVVCCARPSLPLCLPPSLPACLPPSLASLSRSLHFPPTHKRLFLVFWATPHSCTHRCSRRLVNIRTGRHNAYFHSTLTPTPAHACAITYPTL